ncbi:AAA family ATPase [Anabaena sp. UHCC 0204]|uniref:AAA family ATPase n=1 Tax=Anabaena sp. UHCC 0204 TaxID=2590009 RepID=UPI0014476EE1|nr:AAA family ATPase [Anabaena sp. UHCC 0204]MTJ09982.1 AAA family ATPase [Anabaena sp. UHCC 0204]
MLEKLILHNFKSHKSTELNFDNSRLHGIVGKNSAGKTTVLQALYSLSMLTHSLSTQIFENENSPQFITTMGEKRMSITASGYWQDNFKKKWKFFYSIEEEKIYNYNSSIILSIDGHQYNWDQDPRFRDISKIPQSLKNTIYLKLIASNLAKATYSDEVTPRIEFDGSGLAPTLDFLRDEAPDQFQLIEEKLSQIVPNVRKVGIKRAKVPVIRKRLIEVDGKSISYEENQEMIGQEIILNMNTGERIPAHAISEGTMLTLGLLTVLMNPNQPNLVLLDDVEQGLHPKAQRELMTVFKEIIAENPNLQIIFSTHSPYIIDALTPSQVHILNNSKSGFTIAKRLDEHPDVEWAKETLTTGEFWDAEGEDWVVEGEVSD